MARSAPHTRATADRLPAYAPLVRHLGPGRDLLALHRLEPRRYPVLLESSAGAARLSRFDILMAFPGEGLVLDAEWALSGPAASSQGRGFLPELDRWWSAERATSLGPSELPFHGGWFLFLAYELAGEVEPRLALTASPDLPVALARRFPAAVIVDRANDQAYAITEPSATGCVDTIAADYERASALPPTRSAGVLFAPQAITEDEPERFLAAVRQAQQHISSGDVYQANISRRWCARLRPGTAATDLYGALRDSNPAPFGGLALLGDAALICSSPERLVRVRNGVVETRPIAGTRPRRDPASDEAERRARLLANPKERAEHVMLIDLERNDLGRICEAGSVRVDEFMTIESYAHVHHIVSNVSGRLAPDVTPGQVLRAVFPGGTITGCPKVRCMDLIHTLEGTPRGAYTGAMGYLNRDGSCDLNILIRSMTLFGDELTFSAGSGIVADSVPELELAETRAKAKGMLLSLGAPV